MKSTVIFVHTSKVQSLKPVSFCYLLCTLLVLQGKFVILLANYAQSGSSTALPAEQHRLGQWGLSALPKGATRYTYSVVGFSPSHDPSNPHSVTLRSGICFGLSIILSTPAD